MLIDNTFFIGKITVPNLGIGQGKFNINPLIERECYSFLQSLLGNEIYFELETHFDDDLNLKDDAPQKFKDLLYGKIYDNKQWKGLIQISKLNKTSVLADWVYLQWLEESISVATNNGQVVIEAKNAIKIDNTPKQVEVWNGIVRKIGEVGYSKPNISYQGGIRFIDWYGKYNTNTVSLTEFLNDFRDLYPNPTLTTPNGRKLTYINKFGL